jgi:hypothetical protein
MRRKIIFVLGSVATVVGVSTVALAVISDDPEPVRLDPTRLEARPSDAEGAAFVGDLLGIQFGSQESLNARGIAKSDPCPTTDLALVNLAGEGEFVPPTPSSLPLGAIMPKEKPGALANAPNPGTNWCPDTRRIYSAWRYYEIPRADYAGPPYPFLSINRFVDETPYTSAPYAESELEVVALSGRQVIVTRAQRENTAEPEGIVVFIPEPTGYIGIHSEGVAREDVIKTAESLIANLKPVPDQATSQ